MDDLSQKLYAISDKLKEIGMETEASEVATAAGIVMMHLAKGPEPKYQKTECVAPGYLYNCTQY